MKYNYKYKPSTTKVKMPLNKRERYRNLSVTWIGEHVVQVALNRPHKLNAVNRGMWKEIGEVFSSLGTTGDGCRCILLVGNGDSFSAGIDVTDTSLMPSNGGEDAAHIGIAFTPLIRDMQACFTALEKCPVPVVAAIHGNCIGAGVDLICAADVRWCTDDTIFSVREVRLGLAADVGTLQRLPKIVGNQSWVRDVCLSGRNFDASEALQMGLVSRVVSGHAALLEHAITLCAEIASHSPVAVQGTKKGLIYARDHSVADGLEQISSYNALALQSQDLQNAWMARATKTKKKFSNLPRHSRL